MTDAAKLKQIELPEFITVRQLAEMMDASAITIIKELMSNGIMANINQQIDFDTAAIVAEELGFDAVLEAPEVDDDSEEDRPAWRQILEDENEDNLQQRPPVITMLGHVDHGKTSLLDLIRTANVQAKEAGGITQHIGAYQATHNNQLITFLDTPGHEAFTAMRARGAQATDIAILVVAADDGVMPQTREAVDHARAAKVPIIVALNKIDLPTASPDRVKQQLLEIGLAPDDWDGDTMVIPVSAKKKTGIEDLLEAILLTAEEITPRANPNASASGTVLEARKVKGRGIMTTLLIQNGSLKKGDVLVVGEHYGKVKAMFDYTGKAMKVATPATPVAVAGLSGMPSAGDQFRVAKNEKHARKLAGRYTDEQFSNQEEAPAGPSLEDFFARLQEGETKTLNLILKADAQGSLEPINDSLKKLNSDEVELVILREATGNVTESDVMLAAASGAVILGFNVGIDPASKGAAIRQKVEVKTYTIIYKMLEDIERAMKGMMAPVFRDVIIGRAELRDVFKIRQIGFIAGCFMRTGMAKRKSSARVIRNEKIIHSGEISSLKHFNEDVKEIKTGFEFGVNVAGFNDYRANDIIEFFIQEQVPV